MCLIKTIICRGFLFRKFPLLKNLFPSDKCEADSVIVSSIVPDQTETLHVPLKRKSKTGLAIRKLLLIVSLSVGVFFGYHYFFGGDEVTDEELPTWISIESLLPSFDELFISEGYAPFSIGDERYERGFIATVHNNEVLTHGTLGASINYIEHEGAFISSTVRMGYHDIVIYSLKNGELEVIHMCYNGGNFASEFELYPEWVYYWDNTEVTESKYNELLSAAFDFHNASDNEWIEYEEMIVLLGGTSAEPLLFNDYNWDNDNGWSFINTNGEAYIKNS